jgi:5-oxopent-3-ene-1,2,5-tricarboxylate decarboxylase/2-hydroxyhepta-2,4-diene-1,7-dioate isomerase
MEHISYFREARIRSACPHGGRAAIGRPTILKLERNMYLQEFESAITGTVYGVVLNDRASVEGIGAALAEAPYQGAPKAPVLYIKPANTLAGDGATVALPPGATRVEIGATVGIVIKRPATRIDAADAALVIAGYVLVADLSLPHSSYYRPAFREKCFDDSCVIGARMWPVAVPEELEIVTFINEREVDRRSLHSLVREVPVLLSDVSEFMTLSAGDVLLTGVRWQAPSAAAGDHVTLRADGLGELSFTVAASASENQA